MLKRSAASALGALRRLSNDSSRLFSTAGGAYPVIDHTFDAIVVGAGNLGRKVSCGRPIGRTPKPDSPLRVVLDLRLQEALACAPQWA